jgi:hypothetical protein
MKTLQKSILIAIVAVLVIGAGVFALPAVTAAAQSPTPAAPQPQPLQPNTSANRIARLEKIYQTEQNTLERQSKWSDAADKVVARVQAFIANLKAKGIDPTRLEAALANFQTKLSDARAFHATAAGILSTHAGFDANGKVISIAQATDTVKSAHQALSDARSTMSGTIKAIQQVVKDIRAGLKPNNPTK